MFFHRHGCNVKILPTYMLNQLSTFHSGFLAHFYSFLFSVGVLPVFIEKFIQVTGARTSLEGASSENVNDQISGWAFFLEKQTHFDRIWHTNIDCLFYGGFPFSKILLSGTFPVNIYIYLSAYNPKLLFSHVFNCRLAVAFHSNLNLGVESFMFPLSSSNIQPTWHSSVWSPVVSFFFTPCSRPGKLVLRNLSWVCLTHISPMFLWENTYRVSVVQAISVPVILFLNTSKSLKIKILFWKDYCTWSKTMV